jgi:hypothetical protein
MWRRVVVWALVAVMAAGPVRCETVPCKQEQAQDRGK